jgi:hypothetical protein
MEISICRGVRSTGGTSPALIHSNPHREQMACSWQPARLEQSFTIGGVLATDPSQH